MNGRTKTTTLLVAGIIALAAWIGLRGSERVAVVPRVAGITLDARRTPGPGALASLSALGVSHVALVPYAFHRGDRLRFNPDSRWYSESDEGVVALADSLADRGIAVVVKPQVWMGRNGFPGDLTFPTSAEWEAWEQQYLSFILHHARLAARIGSDWFVVGAELRQSTVRRPEFWRTLIREVREVFSGKLTYAANWYEEVDSVSFWDELDAIGVQGYYPLAATESPSLEVLDDGWAEHTDGLERLSQRWKRPVLFTEVGYRSTTDAAIEPWLWTPRPGEAVADEALQARLFEAFFRGPWNRPWVAGAFVWKWYGNVDGRRLELDFSPQGKPAEDVIRRAYRQARPRSRPLTGDP